MDNAELTWKKLQMLCNKSSGKDNILKDKALIYKLEKKDKNEFYEVSINVYLIKEDGAIIKKVTPGIHISYLGDIVKYPSAISSAIGKLRFMEVR